MGWFRLSSEARKHKEKKLGRKVGRVCVCFLLGITRLAPTHLGTSYTHTELENRLVVWLYPQAIDEILAQERTLQLTINSR